LISLERDPKHAAVARANLERAGFAGVAEVRVGKALDSLPSLTAEGDGPFDLIFIDADKPSNPAYFEWALRLARPGSLIIVDNVVRQGAVIDADSRDPNVLGVRDLVEMMAKEPRVDATALQTVGDKGHDGVLIARVR
jgi:predicted O-methyltransferase YrrM